MSRLSAAVFLLGAIFLGSGAFAQSDSDVYNRIEELHGDAAGFDRPLRQLVQAMRAGDAETIAGLAEYPLTVKANGESYDVASAEDFVDNFDDLVTPETRSGRRAPAISGSLRQQRRRHARGRRDLDGGDLRGQWL
ncbi:hypothetical protein RCCGE510_12266 [Rhizobium sp. CCGE 510]|nr:hypothetical protein RCCGE510_12266 [Rhizobium sp. CCGE 510]